MSELNFDDSVNTFVKYYNEVNYHVSNNKISVIFDGKGAITSYSEANKLEYFNRGFCCIHVNDKHINMDCVKKVDMIGRIQNIEIRLPKGKLIITQFLDEDTNEVYMGYKIKRVPSDTNVDVAISFGRMQSVKLNGTSNVTKLVENSMIKTRLNSVHPEAKMFFTFDENVKEDKTELAVIRKFNKAFTNAINTIESVNVPSKLDAFDRIVYYNTYFCALENYKEQGEYKAFMAGHKYLLPMRSYYRDSYYTVLPLYNGHLDKVRNQVITLAKGILDNGDCPSAVKSDYSPWWVGHYDSPSFFVMMLYDYVNYTNDKDLLHYEINGDTILEKAIQVMNRLAYKEGKIGLLYKDGNYNKCDWADEVNRNGYVTYNNILYARAYQCLVRLCMLVDKSGERANYFMQKYYKLVKLINTYLWDDTKGHYVNFKTEDYVEDNLSIDTVLAVNFGIIDGDKAKRLLENMEKTLECANNPDINKDFGVMCVYPPYKRAESAYNKSSQPFNYHNGANWPYLTAMYAHAKRKYGMHYHDVLTSWFNHNTGNGNYTPVEYYSPYCADGSLLQAWNGAVAFVLDKELSENFWD